MTANSSTVAYLRSSCVSGIHGLSRIPLQNSQGHEGQKTENATRYHRNERTILTIAEQSYCFAQCGLLSPSVENNGLLSKFQGVLGSEGHGDVTIWIYNHSFSCVIHKEIHPHNPKHCSFTSHSHFQSRQRLSMQFLVIHRWSVSLICLLTNPDRRKWASPVIKILL